MNGEEIHANFVSGDARALGEAAAALDELVARYQERADAMIALTARMEGAWQGEAGQAARRGAGPMAVEHGVAAPDMKTVSTSATHQVEALDRARNSVVPVPPKPQFPGLNFAEYGTYFEQRQKYMDAAHNNVRVMSTYGSESVRNAAVMPAFQPVTAPSPATISYVPPPPKVRKPGSEVDPPPGNPDGWTDYPLVPRGESDGRTTVSDAQPVNPPTTTQPPPQQPVQPPTTRPGPPGLTVPIVPPQGTGRPTGDGRAPIRGGSPRAQRPGGDGTGRGTGRPGVGTPKAVGGTGGPGAKTGAGVPGAGVRGPADGMRGGPGVGARPDAMPARFDGARPGGQAEPEARRSAVGAGAGAGGKPAGGEDVEHERAPFLLEDQTNELFESDVRTAPPVIGE